MVKNGKVTFEQWLDTAASVTLKLAAKEAERQLLTMAKVAYTAGYVEGVKSQHGKKESSTVHSNVDSTGNL